MVIYLDGVHIVPFFHTHTFPSFTLLLPIGRYCYSHILLPWQLYCIVSMPLIHLFIVYLVSSSSYFSFIYVITANWVLLPYFVTLVLVLHSENACYVMYNCQIFVTCILYSVHIL